MRKQGWLYGATLLLTVVSAIDARAQIPNCGSTTLYNDVYQLQDYRYVEAIVRTSRSITGCVAGVEVEAWIGGVGGAATQTATYTAEVIIGRPVPNYNNRDSYGKHFWIWAWPVPGGSWESLGTSHDQTSLTPPNIPPKDECELNGDVWNEGLEYCEIASPILIDMAHDGYHLTDVEHGVRFDLDNDGVAEQVAWTRAESDDAWLAMDRNGNGVIDNGSELFGDATPAYADQAEPTAANGFEALKFTEGPSYGLSRRGDGVIDRFDAIFQRLLLWRDRNHNGISEPDELEHVTDSSLVAISTEYRLSKRRDRFGNEFRQKGKGWFVDNATGGVTFYPIFDVWLRSAGAAATGTAPEE
jgi:hypothetical protein